MENKNKYILAVDLGTSGPKTALVSVYGEVVGSELRIHHHSASGGGAEQDRKAGGTPLCPLPKIT